MAGHWLASNPSKRWAEVFFLSYSAFWITWALLILVPFQLYEVRARRLSPCCLRSHAPACMQYCEEWGYLLIGVAAATPCFVLPMLLQTKVKMSICCLILLQF